MTELAKLEHAERLLAECASAADAQNIIDLAEAARVYAKQAKLGVRAVNHATHIKLQADRLLADFVDASRNAGTMAEHGGDRKSINLTEGKVDTAADLGISHKQIHDSRLIARHFTPEEIAARIEEKQAKGEEISRGRLLREARDRRAAQQRDQQAKEDQTRVEGKTYKAEIRHGDFRDVLADLHDIDAIITDPPYPREYLPLLGDLALFADKVLAPDGVMVVLYGHTWLPEAYRLMECGRPYRWTGCYLMPGPHYTAHARRVQSGWKPFIVYGGGPRFMDVVATDSTDSGAQRLAHEWGQDLSAFRTLIERFTRPGQTVCDPFAGSGTTLLAAQSLNRAAIGAEIDADHYETTRARLT